MTNLLKRNRVAKIFGVKVHEFASMIDIAANRISSIRRKYGMKGLFDKDIAPLVYALDDGLQTTEDVKRNYFYEYEKHMKKKYTPRATINKLVKQAQKRGDLEIFDKLQGYIKECRNQFNEVDPSDDSYGNMLKIQIIADMNRIDRCINDIKGEML